MDQELLNKCADILKRCKQLNPEGLKGNRELWEIEDELTLYLSTADQVPPAAHRLCNGVLVEAIQDAEQILAKYSN